MSENSHDSRHPVILQIPYDEIKPESWPRHSTLPDKCLEIQMFPFQTRIQHQSGEAPLKNICVNGSNHICRRVTVETYQIGNFRDIDHCVYVIWTFYNCEPAILAGNDCNGTLQNVKYSKKIAIYTEHYSQIGL